MKTIDDQSLRHVYAEMSGAELGSIDPSPLTGAAQEVLFAELARHEEKIQKIAAFGHSEDKKLRPSAKKSRKKNQKKCGMTFGHRKKKFWRKASRIHEERSSAKS